MNIRDKLKFIDQIGKTPFAAEKSPTERIPIESVIPGENYKSAFVISHKYDGDYVHGDIALGEALKLSSSYLQLAGKDANLIDLNLEKSLFFDTETTGLSGGSGTYIFLAGFGYFADNQFHVKQFFLRHPGEENAMLHVIAELISEKDSLVSFNGKSFDWPLLKGRMIFHRIWRDIAEPVHLDLLHAARRVWKNSLPDCSLSSLEKSVLNVSRDGDVPSWEIPERYFRYLRSGDPTPLLPVFYHNKIDILSLVSLTARLHQVHRAPVEETENSRELFSLASYYEKNGHLENAIEIYRQLLAENISPFEKRETQLRLAYSLKRMGQIKRAAEIWGEIISSGTFSFEAYEELAKYFEHHAKDIVQAHQIVTSALSSLEIKEQLHPTFEIRQLKESLHYRLHRLNRKLGR
ncbi:MAG: tetratricopeptide repeat protein [Calditrichaeota bacterium]|nr:tetratricopeptide repeat protein [Calditrichota bacterium]